MSTGVIGGNVKAIHVNSLPLAPASVPANSTSEQTFAYPGATVKFFAAVTKLSVQPGLGIVNVRISAPGILAITFVNVTGAAIVPNAENYLVFAASPEGSVISGKLSF